MRQTRRQVEKIRVPVRRTFDQEFWPVLVALGVLLGIAGGAILTLMRGPWMWGSLLILPALAALAIYSLYRLDDSRLRRSFQLAIMISFAVHLLILMFASMTHIFNNPYQPELTKIAPKENKSIVISQRQNKFVWQQSNKHTTPEPEVETQRKQSQTNAQPQTVPVESREQTVSPQVVRRESTRPTVPRLDRQSSQLRRQMTNTRPKSTAPAVAASETSKLADTRKTLTPAEPSDSASPTRQQPSASTASKSTVETRQQPTQTITQPVSRRESANTSPAPASESQPMARIERQTPRMPKMATVAVPSQSARPSITSSRSMEAAESSLARQNTTQATSKSAANPKLAETRAVVSSSRRQQSPITQPTLSKPEMTSPMPRTTTTQATVSATTANVASPSRPISAKTSQPRQPSPQSLAVARAMSGTAGAGRSANLDRGSGGVASPARVASDSSSDRRQDNRVAKNISLSSQQRAEMGRATARALKPSSSFKADMSEMAKLAGSKSPSLVSESSSASNIDAATAQTSANSVAEKGQAQIDLGPTKIVNGPVSNRRSGGGMPEIAESSTPSNRPAGRTSSDKAPTQVAAAGVRTQGPLNPSSMPVDGQENQFQQADEIARADVGQSSDQNAVTSAATTIDGPTSTSDALQFAEHPSRNESDWSRETDLMDEDELQRESLIQGNAKTMLSQAPNLSRSVDFGFENPQTGQGRELNAAEGESLATEVLRRAADSVAGSVLSRSAGTALVQAATSMPIVDTSGKGNRNRSATVLESTGFTESEITPNARMQSKPLPKMAGNSAAGGARPSLAGSVKIPRIQSTGSDAAEEISRNGSDTPGAELDIAAVEGPAGLAATHHVRLGIQTRPASTESDSIAAESITRFRRKDFGGVPAMNPDAVLARDAFRLRQPSASAGAPPSTEVAIQSGLEFLARYQLPDGSWTLGQFDVDHQLHQNQLNSDTAATGLALIAFQGAGYNHREFKYARQLQLAIDWMLANQSRDGGLYLDADDKSNGAARMYSHAIATLALTEAYGMTQDSKLREPAQRAINYISRTQDPERGGWRYFADQQKRSSDTSVTGWMMMALVSGQLSGLDVNPRTLSGIDNWLTLSRASDTEYEFRYNPFAVDTGGVSRLYSRKASQSMTAVGLLMQVYSGWDRDDPRFQLGAEQLLQQLPSDANAKLRDTYYWYYATQVLKHAGGQAWEDWNARLQPLLVRSQEKDGDYRGSWDPYQPVPDRWGPHGGRLYVTAMNLLSLEVRYRLLPLYDKTIK